MPATKTHPACTIHEDGMWIKKTVTYAKISLKSGEPQRYSWGTKKKTKKTQTNKQKNNKKQKNKTKKKCSCQTSVKKASLDPNCLKHYRPVSNLPFLSKVLRCIVLKQFLQQLQSHRILEPFHFAYRTCYSTETALLRVVNDLLQASGSGCVSILPLLDLSAAFDTTDHNILITRLRSTFGCSGTILDWFISYLNCRTQSVSVGHESTPAVLICGVPQGYDLGPLLFTLYTHPSSTVICQSGLSYHFFADDSQLHKSSVPSDFPVRACCLKDCIEDVAEWMGGSKLKMNDDKTELMAIGTMSKLSQVITNLSPLFISGCDIPFSKSVRNLGFYLDETLSMDAHIKYLRLILFCQLRGIGKIRSFLSTDAANKLAVSLILSRLHYCNSLLAGIPDNKLNKLQRIQNHAADLSSASPGIRVLQHCSEHSTGFQ